ncbi:MAG: 2-C-methyl-D-erythritol 4-phosphate cytidylyltransferase, partial [Gammaproteobacteria bacterium]|nr:2-C-methyl-D-erythritol 4-phosphate cytidylyltransferase [Gammaproteobacteria bacterium]
MQNKQFWAIIPAAGVGKRMLADRPKQYLKLQDKTVIEHTLDKLLNMQEVTG